MWGLEHAGQSARPNILELPLGRNSIPAAPATVASRISKYSYGISVAVPFDQSKHLWKDRVHDPAENIYRANNQMCWLLRRVSPLFSCSPG